MEPLFRRYRLQFKRIRRASDHAHATHHEKTLVPFKMSVYIQVGLHHRHQLRLERAPHRDNAKHAGPSRKDFLTPAFNHVLLEKFGKFLVQQPHIGFVPANQERAQPVFLFACDRRRQPGDCHPW